MKVWVYPERVWEELGAESYTIEWHTLKSGYVEDPNEGPDPDSDIDTHYRRYRTLTTARREAKKRLKDAYYGQVILMKQTVDWYVEEDKIAEWVDVGEPEYID